MSDSDAPVQYPLKYRAVRFAARTALVTIYLVVRLLPLPLHTPLASILGLILHRLVKRNRTLVTTHMELAYGDSLSKDQIQDMALRCNRHMAMNIFEFIRFPAMNTKSILKAVSFDGEEHIKKALEQNKGIIVLSAHFGNWELLGAALVARGYELTVVRRDQNDGLVNTMIQKQRDRKGIKTIPRDKPLFKQIVALLKANELVALIADQNAGSDGIFVDFYGIPVATFKGPALFATVTGAPIIPIFMVREGYMKHRVVFRPALEHDPTGDNDRDILEITQLCTTEIEHIIRLHPEQWMWQHKRWKTDPPEQT